MINQIVEATFLRHGRATRRPPGWHESYFLGWVGVGGLTRFECGGRLGQGVSEPAELKGPTPAMRAEPGLGG